MRTTSRTCAAGWRHRASGRFAVLTGGEWREGAWLTSAFALTLPGSPKTPSTGGGSLTAVGEGSYVALVDGARTSRDFGWRSSCFLRMAHGAAASAAGLRARGPAPATGRTLAAGDRRSLHDRAAQASRSALAGAKARHLRACRGDCLHRPRRRRRRERSPSPDPRGRVRRSGCRRRAPDGWEQGSGWVLAKVYSCAVVGLDGVLVEVEVDVGQGIPGMVVVGLPDAAVRESQDRVRAAIRNSGGKFPLGRVTVNLAPADLKKAGPTYDLPIALGVLLASEQVAYSPQLEDALVAGELSLDGVVRHTPGIISMVSTAAAKGMRRAFVPAVDAAEAALVGDDRDHPRAHAGRPGQPSQRRGADRAPQRRRHRPRLALHRRRLHRGEGAGARQTRAGGGRRRRPQRPAQRPAGLGQDDAGARPPLHPAADDGGRVAGSDQDLLRARAAAAGDAAAARAPLPRPASHHELCRARRRRVVAAAGRDQPGPPRRPLPRRAAGVRRDQAGGAAPAAGGPHGHAGPRRRHAQLPGQLHA